MGMTEKEYTTLIESALVETPYDDVQSQLSFLKNELLVQAKKLFNDHKAALLVSKALIDQKKVQYHKEQLDSVKKQIEVIQQLIGELEFQ